MQDRSFRAALALCDQAIRLSPRAAAGHSCRGESLYRMGRYREAEQAFRAVHANQPTEFAALHRAWAARLQAGRSSNQVRNEVLGEIDADRRVHGDDPNFLLAEAQGYGYLGLRDQRIGALRRLAPLASAAGLDDDASALLLEAAIEEHDPAKREVLAGLYIRYFPRTAAVDAAFDLLFHPLLRSGDREENAQRRLRGYLDRGIETPAYRLALARWLVRFEAWPRQAAGLLSDLATAYPDELPPPDERARLDRGPQVEALYLSGVLDSRIGELQAAERHFAAALRLDPAHALSLHELGKLAIRRGNFDLALDYLRRALEADGRDPAIEQDLRSVLTQHFAYGGDPRGYFARAPDELAFSDVTASAGLDGVRSQRVAWGDYDADGLPDLLLDGRLFRNTGRGSFLETTATAGLPAPAGVNGGLWVDYDNDGDLDLFLTSHGANRLWRNRQGRFTDVTAMAMPDVPAEPTEAAAWGDIDNDGRPDLYVANYELPAVERGVCAQDRLYRNLGDGRFEDLSHRAGIWPDEPMCGRGVTWDDFDGDGRLDITVANYRLDPNLLWINQGDGTFHDAPAAGLRGHNTAGYFGHSIGAVAGDIDNDGRTDLYVTNLAHPRHLAFSDLSVLLMNQGPSAPLFKDAFAGSGLRFEETSADPALGDVDNDGDLDLYVTSIYPGRISHLYINDGNGHFTDRSWLSGSRMANAWGSAFADFDLDGDLDLLVASSDGVRLLRNAGTAAHWLAIRLLDPLCSGGVGASIAIHYSNHTQRRRLAAGTGTGCQSPPIAHFGLGPYSGPIDIEIHDLCGRTVRQRISGPNRMLELPM